MATVYWKGKRNRATNSFARLFLEGIHMPTKKKSRWVSDVKTDSTHPPPGLFKKSAMTIARTLASNRVSPKGPGSGLRMLTYFMNRAGRGLSAERRAELQKAKVLLSSPIKWAKKGGGQEEGRLKGTSVQRSPGVLDRGYPKCRPALR